MIQSIKSLENQHIKAAAALRQKKQRDDTGLFLLEGLHLVEAAITANWKIEQTFINEERLIRSQFTELAERLLANGSQVFTVSSLVFNKIAETETPQGVVAVARQCRAELSAIIHPAGTGDCMPWVVLDAVQDPGNVGTIVRNADAAGVAGVIMTPGCADIYAGKTVRATMGSMFHIPTYKASVEQCLAFFLERQISVYIADAASAESYAEIDWRLPCAIVFGNEGTGVSELFRQKKTRSVAIPIVGKAESLNVASAAAVILFEAARQRGFSLS
jgi:TrmH family RNA methyltransferase